MGGKLLSEILNQRHILLMVWSFSLPTIEYKNASKLLYTKHCFTFPSPLSTYPHEVMLLGKVVQLEDFAPVQTFVAIRQLDVFVAQLEYADARCVRQLVLGRALRQEDRARPLEGHERLGQGSVRARAGLFLRVQEEDAHRVVLKRSYTIRNNYYKLIFIHIIIIILIDCF